MCQQPCILHPRQPTFRSPHKRDRMLTVALAAAMVLLLAATPCHAEVPPWMLGDEQTMKCYFLNKTEIPTPQHIHLSWTTAPPATMYDDSTSNVSYTVEIAPEFWTSPGTAALLQGDLAHWRSLCDATGTSQCSKSASSNCCVFHSNLHSCRSNTGVCSPWVKPQNCTSGTCDAGMELVTHTAAQVGGAERYSHGLRLQLGSWVVIAHIKIMNFQCAVGATRTVYERPADASAMQWVIPLVIAIVCVIVLVAFTNGYQYTRGQLLTVPLKRLAHRMNMTASLQDDDEEDEPSLLAEVADMQAAYGKMKAELNRMRSFLPQSVLNPAGDDDDEEDAPAEQDEGDVSKSSVFSPMNRSRASQMSKMSKRTVKSGASTNTHRSKANGGGLNLSTTIQRKRIAVVVFNTVHFHDLISTESHAQPRVRSTQERLLKAVLPAITENKGVVDVFNGDHVVVSFNAVNNVGQCSKRAVQAALAVIKTLSADATMAPLSIGVAAGSACVGNMGIDGMQRFNIVGGVYTEALAMERYARRTLDENVKSPTTALECARAPAMLCATQDALADVSLEYDVEYADWVRVGAQRAKAVGRVLKAKQVGMDEWMYQVQEGENADPNAAANGAFAALISRDLDEVQRFLSSGAVPDAKRARLEAVVSAEMDVNAATVVGFY